MKKIIVFAILIAMVEMSFAQNVEFSVSGSAMYSSKNASMGVGLIFSEDPAVIAQLNANLSYNKWGLLTSYSGYTGIQRLNAGDQSHLLDVFASYQINNEFTLHVGPEFTYKDISDTDIVGMGLVAMMTWNKNNFSSTLIYYTDPHFSFHYVIGSVEYRIVDNFSAYGLIGVTTAEANPVYGILGLKYSKDAFSAGVYYALRKDAPGPLFQVGFKF
jgi:hypothetical protein